MSKGIANQLFILLILLSLFSAIADLGIEICDNMTPLSNVGVVICKISTYLYMVIRNATNVVLLLFLLALTRTTFLLKKTWARIAFFLPYASILIMLIQNPFTHTAFAVTSESGYTRGPLMFAFYGIALLYGLVGLAYCIYCFRYLPVQKWISLLSIYVLGHTSVFIQFFFPDLLLEIFCTALGEMLIMLSIMRPEERMDKDVGVLSWTSYQADIKNTILSKAHVQIIAINISHCNEIRNYLGDHSYNKYISEIANGINSLSYKHPYHKELYFEKPGNLYLLMEEEEDAQQIMQEITDLKSSNFIKEFIEAGIRFEPLLCLINCPDDLNTAKDIIGLGHKFIYVANKNSNIALASEVIKLHDFVIEAHIEEILDRVIKNKSIEMYYQPIYDVNSHSFHSAEALARINDPIYGMISPAIFIPAAESLGLIIPIGDMVLENVFRFISEHDLDALKIEYIELNLSVAQCVENSLPSKILALQQKYNVDPKRINLEITETTFENISEIIVGNINKLIDMGYSFALDDYGTGYSSIQRVNSILFKLIKIDKSMLDSAKTYNGQMILKHTIQMMHSIDKKLVIEGAETMENIEMIKGMKGDYIQGFYFSKPVPEGEFVEYIKKNN